MAGCPWHGERENRRVEAYLSHSKVSKHRGFQAKWGWDFPMKRQDAVAVLQHFSAQNMELFRSHGAAYIGERWNSTEIMSFS